MDKQINVLRTNSTKTTDFSQFDDQRVAVELEQNANSFLFKGLAVFQRDDQLGRILRICADDPADGDFILTEATWEGRIFPDLHHGCRYCFKPASRGK